MDDAETSRAGLNLKKGRIPLEKAIRIAEAAQDKLFACSQAVLIVGSVRRQAPVVGDVDLLVLPKDVRKTLSKLTEHGFVGTDRIRRKKANGVWIEIYLAHHEREMGALTLHTIGDRAFNAELRGIAQKEGWKLNQYGLYGRNNKTILKSPDERDFFDALGVPWRPPEERSTTHSMGAYVHPENRPDAYTGEMFPGMDWRLIPFPEPDVTDEGKKIWYLRSVVPGGIIAYRIRYQEGGWLLTRYSDVDGKVKAETIHVKYQDVIRAVYEKDGVEIPLEALETTPDVWAVWAAAVGSLMLTHYGGIGTWVDRLP